MRPPSPARRRPPAARPSAPKPCRPLLPRLEALEDRCLLAAGFQLRLEQVGFAPLTIVDGGTLDSNPTVGVITYNGSYGTFSLNVVTPLSKPIVGGPNLAALELSSVNLSASTGGTLTLTAVDTDFTNPPAGTNPLTLISAVGVTNSGTGASWMTYQSWANADNASLLDGPPTIPPGSTTPGILGPFGPGASDGNSTTSFPRGAGPFSLVQQARITLDGPGTVTFGALTHVTSTNQPLGSLGDFVWEDVNANGVQDAGEPGVPDVTVRLLDAGGTTTLATTRTDANGLYRFRDLPAGTYRVQFVRPQGLVFALNDLGGDDSKDSDANPFTGITDLVTLAAGQLELRVDQGLLRPQIVNSTRDLPDSDLSDGFAWTGFYNTVGRPENTLRSAIQQANHDGGYQVILFDIPQSELGWDGKVFRITENNLPAVTTPTLIDGTSQPEYDTPKNPVIVVNRSGLILRAGDSTVKGLAIISAPNAGIRIETKGGNTVENNLLGIDPDGAMAGNSLGVQIAGTSANKVLGNVISGNKGDGVSIVAGSDNRVQGNLIGTDREGQLARRNLGHGVSILGQAGAAGSNNVIGTDGDGQNDAAEGNVISGNRSSGLTIAGNAATGNRVSANQIGTDKEGKVAIANEQNGVWLLLGARDNVIGTNGDGNGDAAEGNTIANNKNHGVEVEARLNFIAGNRILANGKDGVNLAGDENRVGTDANGVSDVHERNILSGNKQNGVRISGNKNVVAGNYIGTTVDGDKAQPNEMDGVRIEDAGKLNRVGLDGASANPSAAANVISGNKHDGVRITGNENAVAGNTIGLDKDGKKALANEKNGVSLEKGAQDNRIGIGGADANALAGANVISGNKHNGVRIANAGTNRNQVSGNLIGTDPSGSEAKPNELDGVLIEDGAKENVVGTNSDGANDVQEGNVISGNTHNGVRITGKGTNGNRLAANHVGTDYLGFVAVRNEKDGVRIEKGAQANVVGTNSDGQHDVVEGNVISGNKLNGVRITNDKTNQNKVGGNYIGTDAAGTGKLPNEENGVLLEDGVEANVVGVDGKAATPASGRNVISANTANGVLVTGKGTNKNVVAGNFVGIKADGSDVLPNQKDGVRIEMKAKQNWVGTNSDGKGDEHERNVISGNTLNGVRITDDGTNENVVAGNYVGTDPEGKLERPNENSGVLIENDAKQTRIGTNADDTSDVQERNVISGNKHNGVRISGAGTNQQVVAGNYVGTKLDGTGKLGNGKEGVRIELDASKNRIGWDGANPRPDVERNVIAFNGSELKQAGHGVEVQSGERNSIRRNSIFDNAGRGINLNDGRKDKVTGTDSFTVNDRFDGDAGANALQNYPVLLKIDYAKNKDTPPHTWQLTGSAGDYWVDFYANEAPDPSGFGEGKRFLKSQKVTIGGTRVEAFQVTFEKADRLISATATDSKGNTSEFSMIDTDADALADEWETRGIDYNEDGTIDLTLGSKVDHEDIFVEVDAMKDRAPAAASLQLVADAFAAAPAASVNNPDGTKGVTLHTGKVLDDAIPIPVDAKGKAVPWGPTDWDDFDKLKTAWFGNPDERKSPNWANIDKAKRLAYRYGVFADEHEDGSSGIGEIGGNDFYVTLGDFGPPRGGTAKQQQGTFMHELGHTLGLRHGGSDNVNYKPNYPSVMNYTWQMPQAGYADSWDLVYSERKLDPLDERALDEATGIGGRDKNNFGKAVMVPIGPKNAKDAAVPGQYRLLVPEQGAANFNNTGKADEVGVPADLNFIRNAKTASPGETLVGFDDWSNLSYYFVEARQFPDGTHGDSAEGELSYDLDTALRLSARFDFGAPTSSPASEVTPFRPAGVEDFARSRGYGWVTSGTLAAFDRGRGDDLTRDGVAATGGGTFVADVPDGDYIVSVILGDLQRGQDQVSLLLQGDPAAVVTTKVGQFYQSSFLVTITTNLLTLELRDQGGEDLALLNSVTVTPVGSMALGQVRGVLWEDVNGNAVFDAGERPLAGRPVTLEGGESGTLTAVTDADGQYVFARLAKGTYRVTRTGIASEVTLADGQALSLLLGVQQGSDDGVMAVGASVVDAGAVLPCSCTVCVQAIATWTGSIDAKPGTIEALPLPTGRQDSPSVRTGAFSDLGWHFRMQEPTRGAMTSASPGLAKESLPAVALLQTPRQEPERAGLATSTSIEPLDERDVDLVFADERLIVTLARDFAETL